jgi:transcriptional regulator with XRE-family HTH domain
MGYERTDAQSVGFRDQALRLRGRAGVPQHDLAASIGVSARAVRLWEAGLGHPSVRSLQQLIAFYLVRGAFRPGREAEEASALWAAALDEAPRLKAPFDAVWFAALLADARAAAAAPAAAVRTEAPAAPVPAEAAGEPRRADWGEIPAAVAFHGRGAEHRTLTGWIADEGRRLVGILGIGGLGKTTLAARLAREVAPRFQAVHWRSLRNAPSSAEWLAGAVLSLSEQRLTPAEGEKARLRQLLGLLRAERCLLVLDNWETVLEPGAAEPATDRSVPATGRSSSWSPRLATGAACC